MKQIFDWLYAPTVVGLFVIALVYAMWSGSQRQCIEDLRWKGVGLSSQQMREICR